MKRQRSKQATKLSHGMDRCRSSAWRPTWECGLLGDYKYYSSRFSWAREERARDSRDGRENHMWERQRRMSVDVGWGQWKEGQKSLIRLGHKGLSNLLEIRAVCVVSIGNFLTQTGFCPQYSMEHVLPKISNNLVLTSSDKHFSQYLRNVPPLAPCRIWQQRPLPFLETILSQLLQYSPGFLPIPLALNALSLLLWPSWLCLQFSHGLWVILSIVTSSITITKSWWLPSLSNNDSPLLSSHVLC